MQYQAQDFARCAGNPIFKYCKECLRNLTNSPVNPDSSHQVFIGPWVMEDERCPSFVPINKQEKQK